jgi:SecD/SecF fusion protein
MMEAADPDTTDSPSLADLVAGDLDMDDEDEFEDFARQNPLFAYLQPSFVQDETGNMFPARGPVVGYAAVQDTARVMNMLRNPQVRSMFPKKLAVVLERKTCRRNRQPYMN